MGFGRWALGGGRWEFDRPRGAAAFAVRSFDRIGESLPLRVLVTARELHAIDDHLQHRPGHRRNLDVVESDGRPGTIAVVVTNQQASEALPAKAFDGGRNGGGVRDFIYGLD